MKKSIYNIGNFWSSGEGCIVTKQGKYHKDNRWPKKKLYQHPNNLYNSWVDFIASMINSSVHYLSDDNYKPDKIISISENLIKKMVQSNNKSVINYFFINIGNPTTLDSINIDNSKNFQENYQTVRNILDTELELLYDSIIKSKEVFNSLNYYNRCVIFVPNNNYYKNFGIDIYKLLSTLENKWCYVFDKSLDSCREADCEITNHLSVDEHKKIGNEVYIQLTKQTNFLTI